MKIEYYIQLLDFKEKVYSKEYDKEFKFGHIYGVTKAFHDQIPIIVQCNWYMSYGISYGISLDYCVYKKLKGNLFKII